MLKLFGLKSSQILCAAIVFATAPAVAFSGISAKYDGRYSGTAQLVPTSGPACAPFMLDQVAIKGGHLSSATPGLHVDGFITEEGYIDASVSPAGGNRAKLDGRLDGSAISAGAIDNTTGCSWIVKLEKAP